MIITRHEKSVVGICVNVKEFVMMIADGYEYKFK